MLRTVVGLVVWGLLAACQPSADTADGSASAALAGDRVQARLGAGRAPDRRASLVVRISGNRLLRGGRPWTPRGVSLIGSLSCGAAVEAREHWGGEAIEAAKRFGADAMRFQVSQPLLDPRSAQYHAGYLKRIRAMVTRAHRERFVVILSMQDQAFACGDATVLPTEETVRAWKRLVRPFRNSRGVVLELYNEPDNEATGTGWKRWKHGSRRYVGHQRLVRVLRGLGSRNVLLADGAQKAETLEGLPLLRDPLHSLGYAIHPYYMASINTDPSSWHKRWGYLADRKVVVATEWNSRSMRPSCRDDDDELARRLVRWLERRHIGLFGWALDNPDTLIKDWTWKPTTYTDYTCGVPGGGAGRLLKLRFSR